MIGSTEAWRVSAQTVLQSYCLFGAAHTGCFTARRTPRDNNASAEAKPSTSGTSLFSGARTQSRVHEARVITEAFISAYTWPLGPTVFVLATSRKQAVVVATVPIRLRRHCRHWRKCGCHGAFDVVGVETSVLKQGELYFVIRTYCMYNS